MAYTYSQIKSGLDDVATRTSGNRSTINRARTFLTNAQTDLSAMPLAYTGLATEINTLAAANPTDAAYQLALNEKNKLVADFQTLKAYVDTLIAAFDAVAE